MSDPGKPVLVELSIEGIFEFLLFLYPYGAEQMNLPHNFWLGLGCWTVATVIAIRMFWIFPAWSKRLTSLEKGLLALIGVGIFVDIFYRPVLVAYGKRNAEDRVSRQQTIPQESTTAPPTTQKLPKDGSSSPPKEPQGTSSGKHQNINKPSSPPTQDNSVHVDNGSKIEQTSSGDCSPNIVGGANNINCSPRQLTVTPALQENLNKDLANFRGSSVDLDVDQSRLSQSTAEFAKQFQASLEKAGLNVTRNDAMFLGGCENVPGISFMAGEHRKDEAGHIWWALVQAKVVEPHKDNTMPGCSRSGAPDELHIRIFSP